MKLRANWTMRTSDPINGGSKFNGLKAEIRSNRSTCLTPPQPRLFQSFQPFDTAPWAYSGPTEFSSSVQVVQIADATARFNRSTVHEPMTSRQSPSILKESAVKNCDTLFSRYSAQGSLRSKNLVHQASQIVSLISSQDTKIILSSRRRLRAM